MFMQIKPSSGWVAIRCAELWQFRDLMWSLAARDLKVRYKQTMLGVAWVVLQPLIQAGILSIVFGGIAKLDKGDKPYNYFLLTFCGQLGWNTFGWTVTKAADCLLSNAQLVSKVYFPRLVLPLSTVISTLVDVLVGMGMLAILLVIFRLPPDWPVLLLPMWMALLLLFGLGVGLIAAAMTVTYRDVKYVIPVAIQTLMFASPVMWSMADAPDKWKWLLTLNPLAPLIEGLRYSLLHGAPPPPWHLVGVSAGLAVGIFVYGLYQFKRMERRFADVI